MNYLEDFLCGSEDSKSGSEVLRSGESNDDGPFNFPWFKLKVSQRDGVEEKGGAVWDKRTLGFEGASARGI